MIMHMVVPFESTVVQIMIQAFEILSSKKVLKIGFLKHEYKII